MAVSQAAAYSGSIQRQGGINNNFYLYSIFKNRVDKVLTDKEKQVTQKTI